MFRSWEYKLILHMSMNVNLAFLHDILNLVLIILDKPTQFRFNGGVRDSGPYDHHRYF